MKSETIIIFIEEVRFNPQNSNISMVFKIKYGGKQEMGKVKPSKKKLLLLV
jgi:hypothetical protein